MYKVEPMPPREYVWDLPLDLSPNAVNYLLTVLKDAERLGIEPWETSLHAALVEKLNNLRANA